MEAEPATPPSLQPTGLTPDTNPAIAIPESDRRFQVLVVDDEHDFLHLMKVILERSRMPVDVHLVASGAEALEWMTLHLPDLILLDVMMPDMDGLDLCQRLRSDVRTTFIPILMLTALDSTTDRTRGFLAGTDDYVAKPFDRGELLARVRRILQRTYAYADSQPALANAATAADESNGQCATHIAAQTASGH